jgi:hypothetical protein
MKEIGDRTADLNSDHRVTLEQIFGHPASANIEWRRVQSLLEAAGSATREHNGKFVVTVGDATTTLRMPHGKDIDQETIVDIRHLLARAGVVPHAARRRR